MICVGCLKVDFHCRVSFTCGRRVKFTCVYEIEAMYERPRVNAKVERGSPLTFTRDLPYIVSISLTHVKRLTNQRVYRNRPFKEMIQVSQPFPLPSFLPFYFHILAFSISRTPLSLWTWNRPTFTLNSHAGNWTVNNFTIMRWFLHANHWLNAHMVWLSNIGNKKMMRTAFWSVRLEKPHQLPRVHGIVSRNHAIFPVLYLT